MSGLKLYGVARSRATRNIWLLEEIGISYERVPVIQTYRLKQPIMADAPLHTRSEKFLAINPAGHVPALDDNGLVLGESLAINLHIAKKHGGALGPKNLEEDSLMTMWSFWAALDCEPHTIEIMYHRFAKPAEDRDEKKALAAAEALRAPFALLDRALAKDGYAVGGRFTVADINIAEIVRYAHWAPDLFAASPNVTSWLAKLHARPGFKAMWAMREREPA